MTRYRMASPRFTARMTGFFYLMYIVLASVAVSARRGVIVAGNTAATAANIMAHQSRYELGFACDFLSVAAYVVVVVLFQRLLKAVNASVAMTAMCFGLMGCIIMAIGGVFQLAPLVVLKQASISTAFSADQLQVQAIVLLKLYTDAYGIALLAFAFFDMLIGYLIWKSTFLPRVLGVLMGLAGAVFLIFLAPDYGAQHFKSMLPFAVGEILVILWLLVKGVDVERWWEGLRDVRAGADTGPPLERT
jgi:hypothetical protein